MNLRNAARTILVLVAFICLVTFLPKRTRTLAQQQQPYKLPNAPTTPKELAERINQNQARLRAAFLSRSSEKLADVGIRSLSGGLSEEGFGTTATDIMYFDSVSQAFGNDGQESQGLAVCLAPRVDIGCGCCFNDVPSDQGVISDEDLALMSLVDGISSLRIGYPNISGAGLACFHRQDGLEWLNIAECNLCDDDLRGVARLVSIRHLDLSKNAIKGPGLKYLESLQNLESLDLSQNRLDADALRYLPVLGSLRVLRMTDARIDGTGISNLEKMTQLESLSLERTSVSDSNFAKLGRLTNLEKLNLSATPVADNALSAIAKQVNLQTLQLANTPVSGPGLQQLVELRKLKRLDLNGCNLGNADLKFINSLAAVERLGLHNSRITLAGIIRQADEAVSYDSVPMSPSLISAADANKISDRLPNLTSLNIRIEPSSDPIELRFAGLARLRRMTIHLPHPIQSLTLENLPKLTEFRVLSEGGDRDMPSEAVGNVYLQQLPNLREFKCGIKGTIEMDETVDPKQIDLTLNDLMSASVRLVGNPVALTIRSDESLDYERLAALIEDVSATFLSVQMPEFSREMSAAINVALPDLEGFHLRTEYFASDRPIALSNLSKLKRMYFADVQTERIVFEVEDLPPALTQIELENVSVGEMHFNGCHCRLKTKSARRFDSLHVSDLVTKNRAIRLFARSSPSVSKSVRQAPRDVYLNNLIRAESMLQNVYLQNGQQVENVFIQLPSNLDAEWHAEMSSVVIYKQIERPTLYGSETIPIPTKVVQLPWISETTNVEVN